jgi:hypothetical protein
MTTMQLRRQEGILRQSCKLLHVLFLCAGKYGMAKDTEPAHAQESQALLRFTDTVGTGPYTVQDHYRVPITYTKVAS